MAFFPFVRCCNNLWDVVVSVFDNTPVSLFARDAHAVANTNVDWKETPTELVFEVDLPGLKKQEVQVQVENGRTLSISGQRKKEEVQMSDIWHLMERSSGQFMCKFRLPENAKLDHITAKVENGVLTVVVPKEKKQRPKTHNIEIVVSI